MMAFAARVFFLAFFLHFGNFDLKVPTLQICPLGHSSAPRALLEARLQQNVVLGWHFKEILVRT